MINWKTLAFSSVPEREQVVQRSLPCVPTFDYVSGHPAVCLGKDCACEITQADIDRAARSLHGEPVRQSEQPTAAADYAKPDTPRPLCLADVKRETVDWLWRGWFPVRQNQHDCRRSGVRQIEPES